MTGVTLSCVKRPKTRSAPQGIALGVTPRCDGLARRARAPMSLRDRYAFKEIERQPNRGFPGQLRDRVPAEFVREHSSDDCSDWHLPLYATLQEIDQRVGQPKGRDTFQ